MGSVWKAETEATRQLGLQAFRERNRDKDRQGDREAGNESGREENRKMKREAERWAAMNTEWRILTKGVVVRTQWDLKI